MEFQINGVFPWGRRMSEYVRMFALAPGDHERRILDCAGGPASFNAEWTTAGGSVVSCDPLYRFSAAEIHDRVEETFPVILAGVEANRDKFVWSELISDPADLGRLRMEAMRLFLEDYPDGRRQGRYLSHALPELPLADASFELALVSHFLFLYSDQHSAEFHLRSLRDLLRISGEVRVFPLLDMSHRRSAHLDPVLQQLERDGIRCEIRRVDYEFQRGANEMLVLNPVANAS